MSSNGKKNPNQPKKQSATSAGGGAAGKNQPRGKAAAASRWIPWDGIPLDGSSWIPLD